MNETAFKIYNGVNSELKSPFWHCIKQQMDYLLSLGMPFSMVMPSAMAIDGILSIEVNTKLT
jgi:hypothetical protein